MNQALTGTVFRDTLIGAVAESEKTKDTQNSAQ